LGALERHSDSKALPDFTATPNPHFSSFFGPTVPKLYQNAVARLWLYPIPKAFRSHFSKASRFICSFIWEYFLKTCESPCRNNCVTHSSATSPALSRVAAWHRLSAGRRSESKEPLLVEESGARQFSVSSDGRSIQVTRKEKRTQSTTSHLIFERFHGKWCERNICDAVRSLGIGNANHRVS